MSYTPQILPRNYNKFVAKQSFSLGKWQEWPKFNKYGLKERKENSTFSLLKSLDFSHLRLFGS